MRIRTPVYCTMLSMALLSGSVAAAEQEARVTVRFEPASIRVAGELVLKPITTGLEKRIAVNGPVVTLGLPLGSEWRVECDCDSVWAAPANIKVSSNPFSTTLPVRPTYPVRGTIKAASSASGRIQTITLSIESPPYPGKSAIIPRGTDFKCPVNAEGAWTCRVPMGTHDMSVRAKGFTPLYRWDMTVEKDKGADLGPLTIREGSSVVAWLSKEQAALLKKPAHATLTRLTAPDPSQVTARIQRPVAESDFDRRGYVQLAPVSAGLYVLEVTAPGFAPARVHPIEVFEGAESKLRRVIELAQPLTLRVAIEPPREPSGAAWRARLDRISDFSGAADPKPVPTAFDTAGALIARDIAPGRYRIELRDRFDNPQVMQEITVVDERDAEQQIRVPLTRIKGNVEFNKSPLPGTVIFGTENGAVRVSMTADDNGDFEGYLPRRGRWVVEVRSHDSAVHTTRNVDIKEGERVRLSLGSRSVRGFVLAPGGQRAPNTEVTLFAGSTGSVIRTRSDDRGEWEFRAPDGGKFVLRARSLVDGTSSDGVYVTLGEDEQRRGIELRLLPSRKVIGNVRTAGAPVPGARVTVVGLGVGQGNSRSTVTDVDGTFSLQLPESVTSVLVIVGAPSRSLKAFQAQISKNPLYFEVDSSGGTINLEVPGTATDFWLAQNGIVLPIQEVVAWMSGYGQSVRNNALTIPFMAPATYRFCVRVSNDPPACAEQFLAPNATITLAPRKR